METTRYNAVTKGIKNTYNQASETGKDKVVSVVKNWLKINQSTEDKGKKEAFQCFLSDLNIY